MGVSWEVDGAVLRVVLEGDRPTHPLGPETIDGLRAAWGELEAREEVHAAALTARGTTAFSVGGDVNELLPLLREGSEEERRDLLQRSIEGLLHLDAPSKPVTVGVEGLCVGGGFELMLACDVAVSGRGALFWFPEAELGLVPGPGVARLAARLPPGAAQRLALFGEQIDSQTAFEWGLVAEVVPRGRAGERAVEVAHRLAGLPAQAGIELVALLRSSARPLVDRAEVSRVLQAQFGL